MYIWTGSHRNLRKPKKKTSRLRAKAKAKNRRRVNRMHGRRLSARLRK